MSIEKLEPVSPEEEPNLEQRIIDTLRAEGFSESAGKLLMEWWDRRERLGDAERWQADMRRAEMLTEAGLLQDALDEYNTIAQQAYEAMKDDIVGECDRRIEEIRSRL